jgi:acetyl-CoA carboxylase biotin carboxyl carrier protein
MTIEEINQLIQTVISTGIAELELQRGENRLWIKRSSGVVTQEIVMQGASATTTAPTAAPPAAPAAASAAGVGGADPDLTDPSLIAVKSPIVGTFYESPSPGSAPFVKVGDAVSPGKVLCIIESMKLMNEIECEHKGTIVRQLVENGHPVEYGETMYIIKPN